MNSVNIHVIVEGRTEQTFVRDVLAPHMAPRGIYIWAGIIGSPGHKGGNIRFDRALRDIGHLLRQRQNTFISTMFDYFRIDSDWPGKRQVDEKIKNGIAVSFAEKANVLESETKKMVCGAFGDLNPQKRFIPYIEMHEFEALLFSDVKILARKANIRLADLIKILEEYENPEAINDDPEKAPSKQLEALQIGYQKVSMGKAISEAIGVKAIRKKCPHFNGWLTKIEHLKK